MYKKRSGTQHQHQLEDQHAHQNTLRVDSLVASCVCFAEDGVSGMVKCRVTRCSSADGQVLADDDMDSDTSWVEEVVFLLKHKDGHFTWQSGAYSSIKVKLASSRIILITPGTVTACHESDELSGVRYTFNDGNLDTKWGLLILFERDLDLKELPKVVSVRKLPYTKEGLGGW